MYSLLKTLEEVLPPEEAMVVHALVTARYHVIEKDGLTESGLPVQVLVKIGKQKYALSVNAPDVEEEPGQDAGQ